MPRSFEPQFMKIGVLTAALQELTPRDLRDEDPDRAVEEWIAFTRKIDEAAVCMFAPQAEVLSDQGIPVQGTAREAYRSWSVDGPTSCALRRWLRPLRVGLQGAKPYRQRPVRLYPSPRRKPPRGAH